MAQVKAYRWLLVRPTFDMNSRESTTYEFSVTSGFFSVYGVNKMWGDGSVYKIVQKVDEPHILINEMTDEELTKIKKIVNYSQGYAASYGDEFWNITSVDDEGFTIKNDDGRSDYVYFSAVDLNRDKFYRFVLNDPDMFN